MDAGSLSKCIKALIGDRDKVEVPGLGVFYARMVPARFSDNRTTIYPPSRTMYFRREEVPAEAGDALVEYIAAESGISGEDAATELSWCISRLKSELSGAKVCVLPGLGEMRANSRNDYFFVPDDDLDIYPDGLGLEPVCIKMNQEAAGELAADGKGSDARRPEPEPQPVAEPKPAPEPAPQPKKRRTALWILLGILGFIVLVLLAVYLLHDSIPALDNLLNRILYNAEERQLLGF